jgi:hypothetical protein
LIAGPNGRIKGDGIARKDADKQNGEYSHRALVI